jgi:hypothetical protein
LTPISALVKEFHLLVQSNGLSPVDTVNAVSTVVIAIATVVLTWVAIIQIMHRNQERRERTSRLDAAARVEAMVIRRSLRLSIRKLRSVAQPQEVSEWHDQIVAMSARSGVIEERIHRLTQLTIERHAAAPTAVEEVLRSFYKAADVINRLAEEDPEEVSEGEKGQALRRAQKQLLLCIERMEVHYSLPELSPLSGVTGN